MKILYSELKKLVPGLKASAQEVGHFYTMSGLMMDSFEKIKYQNKTDYLIGLEVRQNRVDCLSFIGLAYEAAANWNLKVVLPKVKEPKNLPKTRNIFVQDKDYIKRILAYEISGIKNMKSPKWLVEILSLYGMNSKNLLVDLSNYVMIYTGHPSHLLDTKKISGNVYWDLNKRFDSMTTLYGTEIKLNKDKEVIIRDDKNILAMAGIVGGKTAEIDLKTESIIAEMAVYDRSIVRKNSRDLKIITEASTRLEKDLDPNGIEWAMNYFLSLVDEYCSTKQTKHKVFNFYPKKQSSPKITFDPKKPSIYAGIEITPEESISILKRLRFNIKKDKGKFTVIPPSDRTDVNLEEDVIEEVIRIKGYEKIPSDETPALAVVKSITPNETTLIERIKDQLVTFGFDEILSNPLTTTKANQDSNYLDWEIISTQNSVNEEFPDLRQSIAPGLLNQFVEFKKKNLEYINIFEIGKVFGKVGNKYLEHNSLGMLVRSEKPELNRLKNAVESLLRSAGLDGIIYKKSAKNPPIANKFSCWQIFIKENEIGIIYKSQLHEKRENIYYAELNLTLISKLLEKFHEKPTIELTKKIVVLDVNIEQDNKENIFEKIKEIEKSIGKNHLWDLKIQDVFPLKNKTRYTLRVSYMEMGDQEAKKLHSEIFDLK